MAFDAALTRALPKCPWQNPICAFDGQGRGATAMRTLRIEEGTAWAGDTTGRLPATTARRP
jgi:hypothetical protein